MNFSDGSYKVKSTFIKKYINIDTKFRQLVQKPQSEDYNTDKNYVNECNSFLLQLPNPITNVVSLKLHSFILPNETNETNDINNLRDKYLNINKQNNYYLLSINDYQNNSDSIYIDGNLTSNNTDDQYIIGKIPSIVINHNNTVYTTSENDVKRVYSGPVTLHKLNIKLYNDNKQLFNVNKNSNYSLNDINYSFLLEVEILNYA